MPFDFKAYDQKCQGLTLEELQREWEHYTRLISGAATSTAVSGCAIPLTLGVSTIGVAMAAPAIHNARKKREIIERHLNRLNATDHTRKRDVLGSMAVSGTIGVVTLGVGTMGADAVATAGAEHGIQSIVANETAIKIVSHAALDGAGMMVEHRHTDHLKKKDAKKAFQKAGVFQAVQDAKAAEAGYTVQQYPNGGQYVVTGQSQALPMPPPPYSAAVGLAPVQSSYPLTPNGYPEDFKSQPIAQPVTYLAPQQTGPQQAYDYSQQQQVPISYAPSRMPSANGQTFSPPQTPATQYPPQQQAQPVIASYTPVPTAQPFDMSTMQQALPMTLAPTASHQPPPWQYVPMPPAQECIVQSPSAQIPGAPQAGHCPPAAVGYIPPPPPTPSGYAPSVTAHPQPTPQFVPAGQMSPPMELSSVIQSPQQVLQHTGYQPPTQPQTHIQAGYLTPQSSSNYQAPLASDLNRGDSMISTQSFTPQPYNPQHYGPINQQEQVYNASALPITSTPIPAPQVRPQPMQYQMPPTPLPTGSTMNGYQYDNKGSYFPVEPQTPQATGSIQIAYQPQYYPPPSPMPVTQ
ncbi:uncharacterized protein FIESC28_09681 [Fusarium coffeatum]|uniref:Uncharacterized protein n=1 Tax=Fusarium coffeatum TaxID=231269 RepID=A0A366R0Q5_9HYPO|nr:uncharacterized protein FIESC28_09681 [Fusarium coffeatum]RBR09830.1 hypothetical protein FIESC28_09681 [Fusarium coffeatum]